MAAKTDIQATRSDAAAGATAIIEPPVRLRGITIASDGVQAFQSFDYFKSGTTLFLADVPSGDVINFNFPEDGILFPKGIFV